MNISATVKRLAAKRRGVRFETTSEGEAEWWLRAIADDLEEQSARQSLAVGDRLRYVAAGMRAEASCVGGAWGPMRTAGHNDGHDEA